MDSRDVLEVEFPGQGERWMWEMKERMMSRIINAWVLGLGNWVDKGATQWDGRTLEEKWQMCVGKW